MNEMDKIETAIQEAARCSNEATGLYDSDSAQWYQQGRRARLIVVLRNTYFAAARALELLGEAVPTYESEKT